MSLKHFKTDKIMGGGWIWLVSYMVLCDFKAGIPHHIVFQDVLIIHQYFRIKKNGEKDINQKKKNLKKGNIHLNPKSF